MRVNPVILALALVVPGCASDGGPSKKSSGSPSQQTARLLVKNDTGDVRSLDDPEVQEIAGHVASLDRKCRGGQAAVYAAIDFASTDLAKNGIQQTRRDLAARLDKNIKGFDPNFDCAGFVAAYLVLRESDPSLSP